MANIQSPNIPENPILFRAGKVNKRELMRIVLQAYPSLPEQTARKYLQTLFPQMSKDYVYNLYKNTKEELRQLNNGHISREKITPIKVTEVTEVTEVMTAEEQFDLFVKQFRTICRKNLFARKMFTALMSEIENQEKGTG